MKPTPNILCFLLSILLVQLSSSQESTQIDSTSLTTRINTTYSLAKENLYKNPEMAAVNYQEVIDLVDSLYKNTPAINDYFSKQADAYRVLGSYAAMDGDRVEALEYQEKSLNIKRRIGERETQILNYQAMGAAWANEGDIEKAGIAADSAYRIAVETKSEKYLSVAARGKANYFASTKVPDSAHYYFKIAIGTADQGTSKVAKYASLDTYARFLREEGKIEESIIYVNKFLEALKDNKDTIFFQQAFLALGESQMDLGNPQKATEYFNEGIYYAKKTKQSGDLIVFYRNLAASYEASKNYSKAVTFNKLYFEEYRKSRDTSAYRERAEVALKNEYNLKKAIDSTSFAQQKLLDESELKRKANNRFWGVVTGLLLLLSGIAFFYFRNRQKVKEQAFENILLNKKVATKSEEVNALLTETIKHIKSKKRIAEDLQKLSKQEEGITLKSIIADINVNKADDTKLMLIKENIENVNYEFLKNLASKHPDLSKTDLEICSFIIIGLSQKDISILRNTSKDAVKKTRYRIRKKMKLNNNTDLHTYLLSFTS